MNIGAVRGSSGEYGGIANTSTAAVTGAFQGVLCVTELQRAGGKRLNAADFLHGFPLTASQCFEPHNAHKAI